jgi:hypothetical protein
MLPIDAICIRSDYVVGLTDSLPDSNLAEDISTLSPLPFVRAVLN